MPTLIGTGASESQSAQSIEVPAVGSETEGNQLYIAGYANDNVNLSVDEAGWTKIAQIQSTIGIDSVCAIFRKTATASEPTSYTMSIDGGVNKTMVGQCAEISGVSATPEDGVTPATAGDQQGDAYDPPAQTPNTDGSWVATLCAAVGAGLGLPTPPSGYADPPIFEIKLSNHFLGLSYKEINPATAEDPGTWAGFVSADSGGISFVIAPDTGSVINTKTLSDSLSMRDGSPVQ